MEGTNRSCAINSCINALFPTFEDEIEITLYDGTGYPDLQGYPEDVPASDDRPSPSEYPSTDGDDELDGLFDLSVPIDASEHGSEDIGTPESSNASHTFEELCSWDLLSEPLSGPYEPIDASEQPIAAQLLPVFNSPALDLDPQVLVLVPGIEEDLAVDTPAPPSGNLCNKKCKGNLLGPHKCQRPQGKLKITCLDSNPCKAEFKTKNDFNRHCRTKHGLRNMQLIDCGFAGCSRVGSEGFTRRDNMLQHMRNAHGAACPVRQFQVRGPVHGYV